MFWKAAETNMWQSDSSLVLDWWLWVVAAIVVVVAVAGIALAFHKRGKNGEKPATESETSLPPPS